MEVIYDEDYYPCEPCVSCEKLYVEDIWLDLCCDEKECIHKVEYEKQREENAIKHVAADVALKYAPQEILESMYILAERFRKFFEAINDDANDEYIKLNETIKNQWEKNIPITTDELIQRLRNREHISREEVGLTASNE